MDDNTHLCGQKREGVNFVDSLDELPDEHCGEKTVAGYGLAYGGIGTYAVCNQCFGVWKKLEKRDDEP